MLLVMLHKNPNKKHFESVPVVLCVIIQFFSQLFCLNCGIQL